MTCCKCNRSGRCQNCSCVKRGQPCQGCLPQRLGNCVNTVHTQPSPSASNDMPSQPPPLTNSVPETLPSHSPPPYAVLTSSQEPSLSPLTTNSVRNCSETAPYSNSNSRAPEKTTMLPQFTPIADPVCTWGEYDSEHFSDSLNAAYAEVVHWKINYFKVPYGKAGKSFVSELARLFRAFATGSALESIALKAATLLPILLLQKPTRKSKARDHITCLERRLCSWLKGDLVELLREGRTIQQRINKASPSMSNEHLARSFANMMFQGKTKAALRLLSELT